MKNQAFHALQIYMLYCGEYLYDVRLKYYHYSNKTVNFKLKYN